MAPIAGLLVEYFVIGCVASFWALPLVVRAIASNQVLPKDFTVVAGFGDGSSAVCDRHGLRPYRPKGDASFQGSHRDAGPQKSTVRLTSARQKIHAFAVAFEPALAKQIDYRSLRDRIARGSLAAVMPLLFYWPYPDIIPRELASLAGLGVVIVLSMLWYRMQKLSASYEMQVLNALREKYPDKMKTSFPQDNIKGEA